MDVRLPKPQYGNTSKTNTINNDLTINNSGSKMKSRYNHKVNSPKSTMNVTGGTQKMSSMNVVGK